MNKLLFLLTFAFVTITGNSQIFQSESVKKRVQQSDLIIYGEVSDLNSSWDKHCRNIYTSYKIKVFRVLKGTETKELTLIQKGGVVDDIWQNVSTSVDLEKGDIGFFILKDYDENEKTVTSTFRKHMISGGYEGFARIKDTSAIKLKPLTFTEEEIVDFF